MEINELEVVKERRNAGRYLSTPSLPCIAITSAGTSAVDRTTVDVTKDTSGVVDVMDSLGMPINTVLLSFVGDNVAENVNATVNIYAGRGDQSSFKKVFSGTITIGNAIADKLPDGTSLTNGRWADIITNDGYDYNGAKVIGNNCGDIAQLQLDLRGCRYLGLTVANSDIKTIITGY